MYIYLSFYPSIYLSISIYLCTWGGCWPSGDSPLRQALRTSVDKLGLWYQFIVLYVYIYKYVNLSYIYIHIYTYIYIYKYIYIYIYIKMHIFLSLYTYKTWGGCWPSGGSPQRQARRTSGGSATPRPAPPIFRVRDKFPRETQLFEVWFIFIFIFLYCVW